MLEAPGSDWSVLELEVGAGTTIGELLGRLASGNADFSQAVFNPATTRVNSLINIFLNDSLLPVTEMTTARLNDGDTLLILPLYAGG